MKTLEFTSVLEKEYVTIRHSQDDKLMWNEWRGFIPSDILRGAMIFSCEFILEMEVELILADFTTFSAPTLEDQVWIATHTAELLQHSKLRRVANILAKDIFQQIAIETIYEIASETPMPCETQEFISKEEALVWLLMAKTDPNEQTTGETRWIS
jgi:hypothetical protein